MRYQFNLRIARLDTTMELDQFNRRTLIGVGRYLLLIGYHLPNLIQRSVTWRSTARSVLDLAGSSELTCRRVCAQARPPPARITATCIGIATKDLVDGVVVMHPKSISRMNNAKRSSMALERNRIRRSQSTIPTDNVTSSATLYLAPDLGWRQVEIDDRMSVNGQLGVTVGLRLHVRAV